MLVGINGVLFSLGEKSLHKKVTDGLLTSSERNENNTGGKTLIGKKDVRSLLESYAFANLKRKSFDFVSENLTFRIDTSIDIDFQNFLMGIIKRSKSRFIGMGDLNRNFNGPPKNIAAGANCCKIAHNSV